MLAERYQWTQEQVEALDPDYMTELMAYIAADGVVRRKHRPKPKKHLTGLAG